MSRALLEKPRVWTSTPIHGSRLPDAEQVNARILDSFRSLCTEDFSRRTHFFGGRYENLYVEPSRIPELKLVLDHVERCTHRILGLEGVPLRLGFWFNAQDPGQSTTEHTHEEDDELLSGVYYVSVPKDSGDLILLDGALTVRARPSAGGFLFFPPSLAHRVEPNASPYRRLSIAFNVGPRRAPGSGSD
jgi:hypothetical protein